MTMPLWDRIILGTAQLQPGYGANGVVPVHATAESLASDILPMLTELGVDMLDTASAYGESESLIGRHLPDSSGIRIITKPPHWSERPVGRDPGEWLVASLAESLCRLGRKNVYGFLFHTPAVFEGPEGTMAAEALNAVKASGLTDKVGVSIYSSEQMERILECWTPEIVQLPVSMVDRRLIADGTIARLARAGIEIHARSIFLRGMLLVPSDRLPVHLAALAPILANIDRKEGGFDLMRRLAACLAAVGTIPEISKILVGVESASQLRQIHGAAGIAEGMSCDWSSLTVDEPNVLNPGLWPQ